MQVTCSCGKILNVPEKLAGKTARCPTCKKILQMPGAPAAGPLPSRITVTCSCGKKLAAPANAAGKKVLCPKCNKELTVPAPARKPSSPVIKPMPPPASYASAPAPAAPRKPAPAPKEDLAFAIEAPPPEPAMPEPLIAVSRTSGAAEKDEYGLGNPKCPSCKADMPHGAQFCVECGTALATGTKIKSAAPASKIKKKFELDDETRKKLIYGVIALIVIGVLIWWVNKPHGMTEAEMKAAAQSAGQGPNAKHKAGPLSE
ncbi:MAG: hypothetical protein ACLQVA_18170 [Candidatus Brocadiia bacterium]